MADGTEGVKGQGQNHCLLGDRRTLAPWRDMAPDIAILLGYNLYIADHPEGRATQESAASAVRELLEAIKSFEPLTPDGVYTRKLEMIAAGLARGIASKKKVLNAKLTAAEERRVEAMATITKNLKSWGALVTAVRLTLLGGFAYAFVMALFGISAIQSMATGVNAQFASIATALAFTFAGAWISADINNWRIANKVSKM